MQTPIQGNILFVSLLMVSIFSCQKGTGGNDPQNGFSTTPATYPVAAGYMDEASGIADSRSHSNALWVEQDSGNPAELLLISHTGNLVKKIPVPNAVNRDWEDLAISRDPVSGKNRLWIADIGDNNAQYGTYTIYRFEEPSVNAASVANIESIQFSYPDGSHDAEAILVDETSQDLYIITKRDAASKIYKLSYPQQAAGINTAVEVGELGYNGVTSAAVSPGGKEILVKTYTAIYQYTLSNNEKIVDALKRQPVSLSYSMEPQGEAICYNSDNSGFFTLSERGFAAAVDLRFYKRN